MDSVDDEKIMIKVESSSYYFELIFDPKTKSWEASGYPIPFPHPNAGWSLSGRASSLDGAKLQLLSAIRNRSSSK